MDNYYRIEQNPGIQQHEHEKADTYDYLDNEDIRNTLLDFHDGQTAKVSLYIPSIHCSSCIWLLENLQRLHSGIIHSYVDFTAKQIHITFNEGGISLRELVLLLESIHYKPLIQRTTKKLTRSGEKKKLLIKLGIAGFAFGNVMLLSFPSYLAVEATGISDAMVHYFSYFSLVLALPVLFYCASDYFLTSYKSLKRGLINIDIPIALGISAIFLRSAYEILSRTGPGYLDSLTGLVFFLLIGKWFQDRTYQALNFESDYTSYFPLGILKLEDDKEFIVPIKEIRPDDLIRVRNQEIIPSDSILESDLASIDYSFITGESIPVQRRKGDKIFAGGRQIGSAVDLRVVKDVETSYLTQLWKEKTTKKEETTFVSDTLNTVSKYFTIIILLISLGTGIFWLLENSTKALLTFSSVLIVACPCALALSVPFAFGHARRVFGKNQFYLKHSSVIENLSGIDTVVFDKTGTLTDPINQEVTSFLKHEDKETLTAIKSLIRNSLHPLSRAIYRSLQEYEDVEIRDFEEITGAGIKGIVRQKNYRIGSARFVGEAEAENSDSSKVFVSADNESLGYLSITSHFREGWDKLLSGLSEKYEIHLLSGDNDAESDLIGQVLGTPSTIHFNQTPEDKLEYIRKLKSQGSKILMVGDGLNDAGALSESHSGISVADDIYQFSPASDAIIYSGHLAMLPKFLSFSKIARNVVFLSFALSFIYNIVGISLAALGILSPLIAAILMPLSSISVVTFTTLATNIMARKQKLS